MLDTLCSSLDKPRDSIDTLTQAHSYQNVPHTTDGWTDWDALVHNESFIDIVISMGATYGLYVITSLLHFEPWHLFTSIIQYMLLLPSTVGCLSRDHVSGTYLLFVTGQHLLHLQYECE